MSIEALKSGLPGYAQDLARNLEVLLGETVLSPQQLWGTVLACGHATGSGAVIAAVVADSPLSEAAVEAAKAASAMMGMNNVYYRALHLMHNREYQTMRSGLRMNILSNPGVDKVDFELWCMAVSAVNGCGLCMDSHEKVLRSHGVGAEQVQATLRIAATVNAIAAVVRAEGALAKG
jgi:lipoyl-dependent peroxiredoxin subunit D